MQLNSFTQFRAIAILFIIAGHSFRVTGMETESWYDAVFENVLKGGTALFVFISGFLFHHVFYAKFNYINFMGKKVKNVFSPYLILGFLPVCFYVAVKQAGFDGYFLPKGDGIIEQYIVPALKYYATGKFLVPYWYIPFIMVVFFLSPLHIKYIELKLKHQLSVAFTLSLIAIFMHRPEDNFFILQSLLYFTPIYLLGITTSMYKELIYTHFSGKEFYLFGVVISLAFIQAYIGHMGSYHKAPFDYSGIDLMYIQKIVFCFALMVFLHRFEEVNNRLINAIAATSFTAFFLHPFFIFFLTLKNVSIFKQDSWAFFILFVAILTMTCVAIAKICKKIAPKYSRYIIGY